ncbi:YlmH family RNA-binding protein [Paenibacillus sp. Marseille-Q7038]
MKTEVYDHFHPDERDFVDKAWEWVERAGQFHEMKLTDFLDPRQAYILESIMNRRNDVQIHLDGGSESAERKRALVAPDYAYLEDESMELAVLSITSADQKLLQLDHGDYMGALLSLGLKRGKIGDIHVLDDGCHTVVAKEVADYLSIHLHQVHRMNVFTDILPIDQLRTSDVSLQMMDLTVASLRLDGIASDVYRLSRSKILTPIKAGRCKVNFRVVEDPSKALRAGDVVSVQGLGRFKLLEIDGVTKKGRFRVKVGKFV